ncbi:hypothetical protein BRADI_4g03083v3 [Brachypodium distachyon]|uniref:F-box domain-containing protein n=1 Tax=Brachypodium distachyon TaxID=15368 RepID=I1IGY8_BRADI|nr:hypothetical protein BRADI_4g03083v3 [Brachypodium distachyon]
METGPCRRIPKRRRPASASPSDGYVDVDRISDLPDGILGDIVSLLPIDQGARTRILASQWRHIWRCSAPLNLNCDVLDTCRLGRNDADEVAGLISHILSSRRGTGRRLCGSFPYNINDRAATVDAWIRASRKLQFPPLIEDSLVP